MSRIWYQWIDGERVEWPAGELPHQRTVFKANFINQFIGWAKYLDAISKTVWSQTGLPISKSLEFISPGDIIQQATFWNNLIIDPKSHDPIDVSWGMNWQKYNPPGNLEKIGTTTSLDSYGNLRDGVSWENHPVINFQYGDNLQSGLREWMMNLRWRMDQCTLYLNAVAIGAFEYITWSRKLDGSDQKVTRTNYPAEPWVTPTVETYHGPYTEGGFAIQYGSGCYSPYKEAICSLLVNNVGGGNTPYISFQIPPRGSVRVLNVDTGGVSYSSSIPSEAMPIWGTSIEWGVDIGVAYIPYDNLPDEYAPDEY